MSACPEGDSEDSAHEMSIASGTTRADSSDHTQAMNFDDYVEWHEATYQPDSNASGELASTYPDHATNTSDLGNSNSEGINDPTVQVSTIISPVHLSVFTGDIVANLPYRVTHETIQALRHYGEWTYPQLRARFGISLASLHRIIHRNSTSTNGSTSRSQCRRLGRQPVVTDDLRSCLIARATASSQNRRLPYTQVAELEGIQLGRRALRRVFESEGYHRRVARIKPFLSHNSKERRFEWGGLFHDWSSEDWMDVIWSDECAFSVGEVSGTVWVTRRPGAEYEEDCLVPRFARRTTIMVWGAINRNKKSRLVIWDTPNWGRITGSTSVNHIIRPTLYPWWEFLHSTGCTNSGYIYYQQDNAPAHRSRIAQDAFQELGLSNYLLPWPASSPDMSPIEGIWCLLKRRIMQLHPRPTTTADLHTTILQQWDNLSSTDIENLTSSMPSRISALLATHGGHTRF